MDEATSTSLDLQLPTDWHDFLAKSPPNILIAVVGASYVNGVFVYLKIPPITLYCGSNECLGERFFDPSTKEVGHDNNAYLQHHFLRFTCRHCQKTQKSISIFYKYVKNGTDGCYKLGEYPPFGPHIPAKAITLIGGDRELFLKGHRAESQGLGIAAFAYYRRVIDSQKNRLLDEIIRVSEHLEAKPEVIADLKKAKGETSFSKAIESIQPAIPEVLLINGQNPLKLLYSALSEGLHDQSDEECLELAQSIRTVLFELAERLTVAMKEDAEIKKAVSKLVKKRSGQSSNPENPSSK